MKMNACDDMGPEKYRKWSQFAGTRSNGPVPVGRATGVFVSAGVVVGGAGRMERLLRRRTAAEFFFGVALSAILVWLKVM